MPEHLRRRVLVSGRVQGVFFRDSCSAEATRLGLAGFVRNLGDGRVEAAFEGNPVAVEELVSWCRVGPQEAEVTTIEVFTEEPRGEVGFHLIW